MSCTPKIETKLIQNRYREVTQTHSGEQCQDYDSSNERVYSKISKYNAQFIKSGLKTRHGEINNRCLCFCQSWLFSKRKNLFFCSEEICHFECFQNVNKKTISGPGHLETSWRTSSGVRVRMEPIQRSLRCGMGYWWSSLCGGTRRRRAYFNQWAEHQPGQVWRLPCRLHTHFEAGEKHDGTHDVYFWTR